MASSIQRVKAPHTPRWLHLLRVRTHSVSLMSALCGEDGRNHATDAAWHEPPQTGSMPCQLGMVIVAQIVVCAPCGTCARVLGVTGHRAASIGSSHGLSSCNAVGLARATSVSQGRAELQCWGSTRSTHSIACSRSPGSAHRRATSSASCGNCSSAKSLRKGWSDEVRSYLHRAD